MPHGNVKCHVIEPLYYESNMLQTKYIRAKKVILKYI